MDSAIVDVDDFSVETGSEVVLIGKQGNEKISADDWAQQLKTINYEIVTSLSSRVPRLYLKNGAVQQLRHFHLDYEETP